MPRPTFSWYPDANSSCSIKPNVSSVKFGDGYELRVSTVINSTPEVWSVTFTRAEAESQQISAFLKSRAGSEAFSWTTPENVAGVFVCREWSKDRIGRGGGSTRISAKFEQVFEY